MYPKIHIPRPTREIIPANSFMDDLISSGVFFGSKVEDMLPNIIDKEGTSAPATIELIEPRIIRALSEGVRNLKKYEKGTI